MQSNNQWNENIIANNINSNMNKINETNTNKAYPHDIDMDQLFLRVDVGNKIVFEEIICQRMTGPFTKPKIIKYKEYKSINRNSRFIKYKLVSKEYLINKYSINKRESSKTNETDALNETNDTTMNNNDITVIFEHSSAPHDKIHSQPISASISQNTNDIKQAGIEMEQKYNKLNKLNQILLTIATNVQYNESINNDESSLQHKDNGTTDDIWLSIELFVENIKQKIQLQEEN